MNDLKDFEDKITNATNEFLCNFIVMYRYLNISKEKAFLCMKELAKRRANKSDFNFEFYIENELKKLPNINNKLSMPDYKKFI